MVQLKLVDALLRLVEDLLHLLAVEHADDGGEELLEIRPYLREPGVELCADPLA